MNGARMKKTFKIGFICGTFDLLHCGHIFLFEDAKKYCDYLIVAIEEDPSIRRKEKNKPILTLKERLKLISAIKYVNRVVTYKTEEELLELLSDGKVDIQIMGSDYKGKYFTGKDLPMEVYFHDRKKDYSTSLLRKKILTEENRKYA